MAKGNVELWLGELLSMQMKSLHGVIREGSVVINEPGFQLLSFIANYIAQVRCKNLWWSKVQECDEGAGGIYNMF